MKRERNSLKTRWICALLHLHSVAGNRADDMAPVRAFMESSNSALSLAKAEPVGSANKHI